MVPLLVLCVLLPAWAISLQARVLRDRARDHEGAAAKGLAEREEASRLVDLRIDFLRALEESVNTSQPALVNWRTGWSEPISCCAATTRPAPRARLLRRTYKG
jgi:hypothetical protein